MPELHNFAKKELEKVGLFNTDSDYGGMMGKSVLDLIDKFSDEEHSAYSASMCSGLFDRLSRFLPISPLTGEDDEWEEVSDGVFQNRRCFTVFKENDEAYNSEGFVFKDRNEGFLFTNIKSRKPITFPYSVPDKPVVLWEDTQEPVWGDTQEPSFNEFDFNFYQKQAATTAQYPDSGKIGGLLYTILGLAGEAGETADQTKKILRDDNSTLTAERFDKIKKELGDNLWYLAMSAQELSKIAEAQGLGTTSLEDIARHNLAKLADRKERNVICGDGGIR